MPWGDKIFVGTILGLIRWKTTSIFWQIEDKLNFLIFSKMEDDMENDLIFSLSKMEDDLNLRQMEENLNIPLFLGMMPFKNL